MPARPGRQDGAVALEAALVLPVVALLLVVLLSTSAVLADQLAAHHAARAAVREVALTGDPARGRAVARGSVPDGIASVRVHDGVATVTVTVAERLLGVRYAVAASATAPLEPVVR